MENASKALLMAGGILISILVIGAFILMFRQVASFQTNSDDLKKQQQIAKFNNQFEPYNKENLTVMELKSVYNKIQSNNKNNPQYYIDSNIIKPPLSNILENFDQLSEDEKMSLQFKCTTLDYDDSEGRVCKMDFKQK